MASFSTNRVGLRLFPLVVLPLALFAGQADSAEKYTAIVTYSRGLLTVQATNAPLRDILREVQEKSGVRLEFQDSAAMDARVTVDLTNLPPERALEQLLRGFNLAFFYDNARLSRVVALPIVAPSTPAPKAPSVALKPTPPPPQGAKPPPTPLARKVPDFDSLVERNRAEGLKAIRDALASPDLRLRKAAVDTLVDLKGPDVIPILNVALSDSDPAIRIDVLEALAGRGELQTVRKALSDSNGEVREKATELLDKADKKQTR